MDSESPVSVKARLEEARQATAELAVRQKQLFLADLRTAAATLSPLIVEEITKQVKETGFALIDRQPTLLPSARGLVNLAVSKLNKQRQDADDRQRIAYPHRFSHMPSKPESFSERLNRSMDHLLKRRDYRRRHGAQPHPLPPFPEEVQQP